ncbi:hypothetical protein ABB37_01325 [Leptomonas pyrrhocoris]|uniref:Uncharacterized protein n=1 Tax=Leptomonas pyrrhocoris TaxID=157538 RepID=A0A0N0VH18_LEPPY|nr:hypothetical protein ABB37_01325 [Leptomonas pyrrhocoris]XP_015663297.1 hypothetical protein ABB37_01325 [Leptomonas pyrrhocoris]KPA84857.1 hypothetical protein ABB37_01325 [Leptomonas pyrrhocoris]KPA84858.1 hypothetical protein ABB37_01325 [Leptomonas pyrrhocoris]|eukprot:XP_015663296.1 hypothetical protein ABB37_01325 [Leptomonas pyrrhocoris]
MTTDTPTQPQEPADAATATSRKADPTKLTFHSLHDDAHDAFEQDKYHRARTHIGGLGHVSAKDVFKNYKRSWLTPFFGSNEPEPIFEEEKNLHPCQIFSRDVHLCLEVNNNSFALCQTRVAAFQHCLKEFSM